LVKHTNTSKENNISKNTTTINLLRVFLSHIPINVSSLYKIKLRQTKNKTINNPKTSFMPGKT
jgi:hypothetical protein